MINSIKYMLKALLCLCPTVLLSFGAAFAQSALQDFRTDKGECTLLEKTELLAQQEAGFQNYSYTKSKTVIYKRRGVSPKTETVLPSLTRLHCLAVNDDKMLVTSAKSNEPYCGWVATDNLLEAKAPTGWLANSLAPCGVIEPISIRDFCSQLDEFDIIEEGCTQTTVGTSVINTKFITDNTSSQNDGGTSVISEEEIDLYPSAHAMEKTSSIKIFNILEVFDVAKNNNTGRIRLLVGIQGANLKGWVNYDSGTVWYSNLSTFFSSSGQKDVFQNEIGVRDQSLLASRPPNLQKMLAGKEEFARYPVLYDYRATTDSTPQSHRPHLQIAFIGRFCEEDTSSLCSPNSNSNSGVSLNSADIMFLIDGTKSMEKYFSLVSDAVSKFTQDYIDDPNYRFGAATYGDFKNPLEQNTTDKMDFKIINKLETNYGDVFGQLAQTDLFIKDVQKDKEEPTNAAIYNAVTRTNWKNDRLRFIIHVADHGDRVPPSALTLEALRQAKIFYIPIAVKGEGIIEASDKFVRQSEQIHQKHLAKNGLPMALKPYVTYKDNIPAFEAISEALVGALNVGTVAQEGVYAGNNPEDKRGLAIMSEIAKEMYTSGRPDGGFKTIASNGYIETAELGQKEVNWDYFVTLSSAELLVLQRSMETVCRAIGSSRDIEIIETSIREMIEALTGDRLTDQQARIYFDKRDSIPLVTKTLLGNGLIEFMRDYQDPEKLLSYRKRFCRGFTLTALMTRNKKLAHPYEGQGGSLIWSGEYYDSKDAVEHNWLYKDFFERGYYYVPLSYLPGWEEEPS